MKHENREKFKLSNPLAQHYSVATIYPSFRHVCFSASFLESERLEEAQKACRISEWILQPVASIWSLCRYYGRGHGLQELSRLFKKSYVKASVQAGRETDRERR